MREGMFLMPRSEWNASSTKVPRYDIGEHHAHLCLALLSAYIMCLVITPVSKGHGQVFASCLLLLVSGFPMHTSTAATSHRESGKAGTYLSTPASGFSGKFLNFPAITFLSIRGDSLSHGTLVRRGQCLNLYLFWKSLKSSWASHVHFLASFFYLLVKDNFSLTGRL
jgi:hypothetical protein